MIGDLFNSPWKVLIVAVVLIVLFGSKKLPHAARSLGQSMRILKKEVSDLHHDEPDSEAQAMPRATAGPSAQLPEAGPQPASRPKSPRSSNRSVTCSGPPPWPPPAPVGRADASSERQRTRPPG